MNLFVISIPNEQERKIIHEFKMDFKKSCCLHSNLSTVFIRLTALGAY